jgi:hypothetical protein
VRGALVLGQLVHEGDHVGHIGLGDPPDHGSPGS